MVLFLLNVRTNRRTNQNGQSRDTGCTGYTSRRMRTNKMKKKRNTVHRIKIRRRENFLLPSIYNLSSLSVAVWFLLRTSNIIGINCFRLPIMSMGYSSWTTHFHWILSLYVLRHCLYFFFFQIWLLSFHYGSMFLIWSWFKHVNNITLYVIFNFQHFINKISNFSSVFSGSL